MQFICEKKVQFVRVLSCYFLEKQLEWTQGNYCGIDSSGIIFWKQIMDGGLLCNLSDEILLANQDPVNSVCVVVKCGPCCMV